MGEAKIQSLALVSCLVLGLILGHFIPTAGMSQGADFVTTYLLPLFFVQVGIELRTEFVTGFFKRRANLLAPLFAAAFGVALPALFFLLIAGNRGGAWTVPTATDITLGLAVLAFAPKTVSSILRARFLALATIDDVIGLVLLLVIFSVNVNPIFAAATALSLVAFWALGKLNGATQLILYPIAVAAIAFGHFAGIQTSLVGVAIGLLISEPKRLGPLQRISGWVVLPLFAFATTSLATQSIGLGLDIAVLTGVLVRPLGKLLGIAISGSILSRLVDKKWELGSWSLIGILGGIGLAVSFLLAELALGNNAPAYASAILGTLMASVLSAFVFLGAVNSRGRRERRDAKSL